ncbi:sensor histidine kinase [Actinoplanes sp. NPDC048796]|uniref:sensor histidine kinase n=1 Tax=Actinoplanes sp. NPDC048796 TaxID=3155640 RepID=UPI0033E60956
MILRRLRPMDAVVAGGFVAFALAEEYFIRMPGWWWPWLLGLFAVLILVRRLFPLLTMLPHVIGPLPLFYEPATIAGEATVNFRLWQLVAEMIAAYTVGRCVPPTGRDRRGLIGAGLMAATFAVYLVSDPGDPMAAIFFPLAPYALGVVLAVQARRTADAASARAAVREQLAREAVMEERVRIARELHDMVAHSVTVMVIQAGVVRRRLDAGLPVDRELLHTIESSGRDAVGELRRTLGLLRGEGAENAEPPAGLDRLDELVAQVREAGLTVTVRREGEPVPIPPAIDMSAYRIVQEALTNVLRHAGPSPVTVTVSFHPDGLHLAIVDDGIRVAPAAAGHGLIGMRERAALFGGELSAGPRTAGGFAVTCRLPLPVVARR